MINKSISVVLPVFNEEANIKSCIGDISQFLRQNFVDFQIIAVDDGSKDKSYAVCLEMQQQMGDRLKIIRHPENKGYGGALKSGLFAAEKELVFFTDSDNQFDITQLVNFVGYLKDYDLVIGYRHKRRDHFFRVFVAKSYGVLIYLIFGLKIKDIDCSFKLFKRDCLFQLSVEREKSFVNTELLIKAKKKGFRIKELPVTHFSRKFGKSSVKPGLVLETLKDIFYMYRRLKG